MPVDYAGTDTLHNEIQLPSDGDDLDVASVCAGMQALKDCVVWVLNRMVFNDGADVLLGPITITGALIVNGATTLNGAVSLSARMTPDVDGAIGRRTQTLVDDAAIATIDCRTDYALVNLTSASNGETKTLTIASTNSPQVGDRIEVHLIRDTTTTGALEIKFSLITIAEFTAGSSNDTKDNEACVTLTYVGAPLLSWRVTKNYNFTVVGS